MQTLLAYYSEFMHTSAPWQSHCRNAARFDPRSRLSFISLSEGKMTLIKIDAAHSNENAFVALQQVAPSLPLINTATLSSTNPEHSDNEFA